MHLFTLPACPVVFNALVFYSSKPLLLFLSPTSRALIGLVFRVMIIRYNQLVLMRGGNDFT
jgi:hypothetical protein